MIRPDDLQYIQFKQDTPWPYYLVKVPKPQLPRRYFYFSFSIKRYGEDNALSLAKKKRDGLIEAHWTPQDITQVRDFFSLNVSVIRNVKLLHAACSECSSVRLSTLALFALYERGEYTNKDIYELLDTTQRRMSRQLTNLQKGGYLSEAGAIQQSSGGRKATLWTLSDSGYKTLKSLREPLGQSGLYGPKHYVALYNTLKEHCPQLNMPAIVALKMIEAGVSSTALMQKWLGISTQHGYSLLTTCVGQDLIRSKGKAILDRTGSPKPVYELTPKGRVLLKRLETL